MLRRGIETRPNLYGQGAIRGRVKVIQAPDNPYEKPICEAETELQFCQGPSGVGAML